MLRRGTLRFPVQGTGGKRYVRTLEPHLPLTAANIEIGLSLRLVQLPEPGVPPEAAVAVAGASKSGAQHGEPGVKTGYVLTLSTAPPEPAPQPKGQHHAVF
jgi:hypothetical protein